MTPSSHSCHPSLSRRLVAALAAIALALGVVLVAALPAAAAVRHLGFAGGSGAGSGWLGDVQTASGSGVFAYCVDPYGLFPNGDTAGTGLVSSIPGTTPTANPGHNGTQTVSGHDIEKLNYALWNWGDANTDVQAAAMDAYIYSLSSSDHPGTGVDYFIDIRVPAAQRAEVRQRFRAIAADTEAHWNDAATLAVHAAITITDAANQRGYVDVSITPASATGTLTLTRATQDGTGATTIPVANGDRIAVTGVRQPTHSYSITADVTASGPYSYEKNVHLYTTPVDAQNQRIVRHGEREKPSVSGHAESAQLSVEFSPVASTAVGSETVNPGDAFVDNVTAFAASGTWYPGAAIVGDYTIYGPFADQPAPSPTVPADAPVAATGSATFAGPGETTVTSSATAAQSGWYAWVWTIAAARQDEPTQGVLPRGYVWQALFADADETSAVPITVGIETDTVDPTVGLFSSVADRVTVTHDDASGPWITVGGAPLVVTLDGTAYWVPGDQQPAQSDAAPDGTTVLGTVSLQAPAPGTYESPAVTVPSSTAGYVVWQWIVHPDPHVRPHSETWGDPRQLSRVLPPTVTTTAHTDVAPGVGVTDVAHVAGTPASAPLSLVFDVYRQDTDAPTCTDATRVADTRDAPVVVTAPGDFESPAVTFAAVGRYDWVASLVAANGTVVASGACADPDESTAVLPFAVTTSASPSTHLGEPATDVATVTGPTPPGASLVFRAYRLADPSHPVCDASSLVFGTTPVALTGPGDYRSEPVTFTGVATYAWVETAYDAAGAALTAGTCGDATELTAVQPFTVTTDADPSTVAGGRATDVAVVDGPTPPGATLVFRVYRMADAAHPSCTEPALVSTSTPIALNGPGRYRSEPVTLPRAGTYAWVETASTAQGEVVARGTCGERTELTIVAAVSAAPSTATERLAFTGSAVDPTILGLVAAGLLALAAVLFFIANRRGKARRP